MGTEPDALGEALDVRIPRELTREMLARRMGMYGEKSRSADSQIFQKV